MTRNTTKVITVYLISKLYVYISQVTLGFELYVTFEPLVTKPDAIEAVSKLLKWIKKEEERLFILNSPTF